MIRKTFGITILILASLLTFSAGAQTTLSLQECRQMALESDQSLQQAKTELEMAGIDRKIARANYFPLISGTGAWLHNHDNISLVSSDASAMLAGAGTLAQSQVQDFSTQLMTAIQSNPAAAGEYMKSPMWQTFLGALSKSDISQTINALGQEIDNALHPDLSNVVLGVISIQQPLYTGGKITSANRIAKLAEDLSELKYDQQCRETLSAVDRSYWQIVSIAGKNRLAQAYADLLHKMEHDAEISVKEGVATASDALQVKVKANEAEMLRTKAANGLTLAKMLLCKQIGLDPDTEIVLSDETAEAVPVPVFTEEKTIDEVYALRNETKSLSLAGEIFEKKVSLARADMLPTVALTANYLVTNPNLSNGFCKDFGGFFNAGVAVKVPIFHGFESLQKTRKAKAEATLYRSRLDEAKKLINLQVAQLRKQQSEALAKLEMAESNLESAEENLRTASIGFEEGVISANTALAAQTAWLQAHSEFIDAGIELQILASDIRKAEGRSLSE